MVSFLGVASYNHPRVRLFGIPRILKPSSFAKRVAFPTLRELLFSSLSSDPSPPFPPSSSLLPSSSEDKEDKEEKEEEHAQNTPELFPFLEE